MHACILEFRIYAVYANSKWRNSWFFIGEPYDKKNQLLCISRADQEGCRGIGPPPLCKILTYFINSQSIIAKSMPRTQPGKQNNLLPLPNHREKYLHERIHFWTTLSPQFCKPKLIILITSTIQMVGPIKNIYFFSLINRRTRRRNYQL